MNEQDNWAISGIRVLELADEKGEFAGRILAGGGADVIKIEPPHGGPTRSIGPFYEDVPHPERSLYFWQYNLGKRGITLNLETADGQTLFKRLVASADVVLESYAPGYLPSLGLSYEQLKAINPRLIMCSITPFGQWGPYRDFKSTDLIHLALGGQMMVCGYDPKDGYNNTDPSTFEYDTPPIAPQMWHSAHIAGAYAVSGILASLLWRTESGEGQYIDCSIHEACNTCTEIAVPYWNYAHTPVFRQTGRHATPMITTAGQVPAGDGRYVNRMLGGFVGAFEAMVDMFAEAGMADDLTDPKYRDPVYRAQPEPATHIQEVLEAFMAAHTSEELFHMAQKRGLTWAPVRRPEENIDDPHWRERGVFAELEHPELGGSKFTYLAAPWLCDQMPWRVGPRAPLVGEHNLEVYERELGLSRQEIIALAQGNII